MELVRELLAQSHKDYFTETELRAVFGSGPSAHNRMSRLVSSGDLIRIKRGFYVLAHPWRRKESLNSYKIANLLWTPSYVSLESALSFHSLIPESVFSFTSVTSKRPREFATPIGNFFYRKISAFPLLLGADKLDLENDSFLVASKEKAVLDKLYLDYKGNDIFSYLNKNLRIEEEDIVKLKPEKLLELSSSYNNKSYAKRIHHFTRGFL